MSPMIRNAIKSCIECLETPAEEWAPGEHEEAADCLKHLLTKRFHFDRSNKSLVAAAKAVLEAEPPKSKA